MVVCSMVFHLVLTVKLSTAISWTGIQLIRWLMVVSSLAISRAHSRFTLCPMTPGCQLHPASSESFLRVDLRSAWLEFMWCVVLTCSQRIPTAWWALYDSTDQPHWCRDKDLSHNYLYFIKWKRWLKSMKLFFSHSHFSVTHMWRSHWDGKNWMTETTTNQTPSTRSLGGETELSVHLLLVENDLGCF